MLKNNPPTPPLFQSSMQYVRLAAKHGKGDPHCSFNLISYVNGAQTLLTLDWLLKLEFALPMCSFSGSRPVLRPVYTRIL
jgi:hypothetical protein